MPLRFALAACTATVLAGCEPNQLYIASHTVVGVNGGIDPQQTNGWLVVGYDRNFATIIPRSAKDMDDPTKKDAMSALACSRLIVNGIMIQRFQESIATGKAAETFAKIPQEKPNGDSDTAVTKAVSKAAAAKTKAQKDFFACFRTTDTLSGKASDDGGTEANGG